jgi:hypothetical protein
VGRAARRVPKHATKQFNALPTGNEEHTRRKGSLNASGRFSTNNQIESISNNTHQGIDGACWTRVARETLCTRAESSKREVARPTRTTANNNTRIGEGARPTTGRARRRRQPRGVAKGSTGAVRALSLATCAVPPNRTNLARAGRHGRPAEPSRDASARAGAFCAYNSGSSDGRNNLGAPEASEALHA